MRVVRMARWQGLFSVVPSVLSPSRPLPSFSPFPGVIAGKCPRWMPLVAERQWKLAGDNVPGDSQPKVSVPAGTAEHHASRTVASVLPGRGIYWTTCPARCAGLISRVAPRQLHPFHTPGNPK